MEMERAPIVEIRSQTPPHTRPAGGVGLETPAIVSPEIAPITASMTPRVRKPAAKKKGSSCRCASPPKRGRMTVASNRPQEAVPSESESDDAENPEHADSTPPVGLGSCGLSRCPMCEERQKYACRGAKGTSASGLNRTRSLSYGSQQVEDTRSELLKEKLQADLEKLDEDELRQAARTHGLGKETIKEHEGVPSELINRIIAEADAPNPVLEWLKGFDVTIVLRQDVSILAVILFLCGGGIMSYSLLFAGSLGCVAEHNYATKTIAGLGHGVFWLGICYNFWTARSLWRPIANDTAVRVVSVQLDSAPTKGRKLKKLIASICGIENYHCIAKVVRGADSSSSALVIFKDSASAVKAVRRVAMVAGGDGR